jgi:EAL domain-containing protein (putative c-di-GMP-specific phosphodiesterase class I)
VLHQLHQLGIRLAVDDFGTGYSSLAYLQQFPIQLLKIDRTFTAQITTPTGRALLRAIIQLANVLNLEPIAEGVENDTQADTLLALGCRLAQGFHLARPAPADQLPTLADQTPYARTETDI